MAGRWSALARLHLLGQISVALSCQAALRLSKRCISNCFHSFFFIILTFTFGLFNLVRTPFFLLLCWQAFFYQPRWLRYLRWFSSAANDWPPLLFLGKNIEDDEIILILIHNLCWIVFPVQWGASLSLLSKVLGWVISPCLLVFLQSMRFTWHRVLSILF